MNPIRELLQAMMPRTLRSYLEFAEQEIVLPDGPLAGQRYNPDTMPWSRALLEEFGAGRYRRFWASGPAQAGKTLHVLIIPLLYHLFELGEDVIVGVPKLEMAQAIFAKRIRPALRRTRYWALMPSTGAGSRGGRFSAIEFGNGASMRFLGAGGGDEQRSGYTSRVVVLTEVDKMDQPKGGSRESDPVSQIEARTNSYGDRAIIFGECTMSTKDGRVYREVVRDGTDTRVWIPCIHCGRYIYPDREHLIGWQEAETELEAEASARYVCQECGAEWSEADRRESLKRPVLASPDQVVAGDGTVSGDLRPTRTYGFRWNCIHNPFQSLGRIALEEWRTARSEDDADHRKIYQFWWAEPYEEPEKDLSGIDREVIYSKITHSPRGVVPEGCDWLTVAIDMGLYVCWWAAWAWTKDARGYCVDYGALTVPQDRQAQTAAILAALREFRQGVLDHGWQMGDQARRADLVLVDSSYEEDIALTFCLESGNRFLAAMGRGSGRGQQGWQPLKPGPDRVVADHYGVTRDAKGRRVVLLDADHFKRQVHSGFRAPAGGAGSLCLFAGDRADHASFAHHICAEVEQQDFRQGLGLRYVWNRRSKHNHYFDCSYMSRAAAEILGARVIADPARPAPRPRRAYGRPLAMRVSPIRLRYTA